MWTTTMHKLKGLVDEKNAISHHRTQKKTLSERRELLATLQSDLHVKFVSFR